MACIGGQQPTCPPNVPKLRVAQRAASNEPLRDMMKAVRIAVLLFLAGCNQIYGLDPTTIRTDAKEFDGPGCSDGVFAAPVEEEIPNFTMAQPQVRVDLLELW